ncbi:uncharacterized protein LOC121729391 [Aricia agestis]|uniref:uncharacterized protein LOC121729391 n=1 Tax=Aricia agestis TaxID=91739 RepID=UPI001C2090D9|nr:uncharacterized protein LOC121729391 [Aricia agestis]
MTPLLLLGCFALLAPAKGGVPNCYDFAANVTFDETQPLGIWHLIHFRNNKLNGTGNPHCLEFSAVDEEDQDILRDSVGKFVDGVEWSSISLKMTIPCQDLPHKKKRHYYLERIRGVGAYRTILFPSSRIANTSRLSRYDLRLKLVQDRYLVMMDCHDKYIFVFSKRFPTGTDTEKQLAQMVEDYWAL